MCYLWSSHKKIGELDEKKLAVQELLQELEQEQVRLNSLKVGDIVFETDCWGDCFEQSILAIDYVTGEIVVQDTSKAIEAKTVYHTWRKTQEELKAR